MSPRARRALPRVAPRPEPASRTDRVSEIVAAARHLVEVEGADALTMRRLGDALGIKAASLYKHLPSRDVVAAHLMDELLFESGDLLHAAVDSGDPVARLLTAY